MKRIHIGDTHDKSDCTSFGYTIAVGRQRDGDFMVILTNNSRWSGSSDNQEWQLRDYSDCKDAETCAIELLETFASEDGYPLVDALQRTKDHACNHFARPVKWDGHEMRFTKAGYIVQ